MAEFIIGKDIFQEPGDLYVITVNTVGVMGAGVAKAFRERHPDLFQRYKHDCKMKIIQIGHPVIYKGDDNKHYMMFPTKERWQDPSLPSYISAGLQWMVDNIDENADDDFIDSKWKIVMPPLGCGHGKLHFPDVRAMIEEFSQHIPNQLVVVYPPWMESVE
ncbi:hypothetical protein AVT69_gp107 [Pseudomonas phage PhiPA3]|uniref:Uncharacterized protein 108 n=1 Tax=Pseudomonas phage PhiPA3 TaxID=998086 RepID=F8SJY4_BPPA3|nr:hypothetical protein AVT69_gp107 [Pseudomonas phage PhiPA3]AEH03532.1 hypothetical protein [Pseudomonas phage PhiPA3]